ncbi:hypothetical protein ACWDBF_08045 [Streptomyces angustmyceticus]
MSPAHQQEDRQEQEGSCLLPTPEPPAPTITVPRRQRVYAQLIETARQARITAAPVHAPSQHEQAGHELGLVIALVLDAPEASRGLDALVNNREVQPEGAEVFAALLYVTGRPEAAEFWWHFAAGAGSRTAAYCLHLRHLHLGEIDDADYWRAWHQHLVATPRKPTNRPVKASQPLLPDPLRRNILARSHHGLEPQLPAALEAVINQLPVDSDDEDYGEIPRPLPTLRAHLTGITKSAT